MTVVVFNLHNIAAETWENFKICWVIFDIPNTPNVMNKILAYAEIKFLSLLISLLEKLHSIFHWLIEPSLATAIRSGYSIWLNDSHTLLWVVFAQHCFSFLWLVGICFCRALLRPHHIVSIRLKSGLWLRCCNMSFFSLCVVNLLLCLGSWCKGIKVWFLWLWGS